MNSKRQALVDKAFLKYKDGNGVINASDLK